MAQKRIIELDSLSTVTDNDYIAVDNATGGTKKYKLKNVTGSGSGLTDDIKQALLQLAAKVAYIDDDGQDYYDDLEDALYPPVPPATLSYITCVYTQSVTVYTTDSLNSLKSDLVVTAHYSDSTSATVVGYTLSGALIAGTSTITVTYSGKTTTFNVIVSESRVPTGYTELDYIKVVSASGGNIKGRGIKTAVQLSPTYFLETKFKYPSGQTSTEATCLMGTRVTQTSTKQIGLFIKTSTDELGYWFAGTDSTTSIPAIAGSVNTIKVKPVGKSSLYPTYAVIEANGTEYPTGSTTESGTWSDWFGIMQYQISATNLNGYDAWSSLVEQGEIIIKNNSGVVLYDFIPAYNGTYFGFYESINEQFYYDSTYYSEYTGGNWT